MSCNRNPVYYVYPNKNGDCRPVQINCPTGYTGYTGPAGDAMFTGATGYTGPIGTTGYTGYTGPIGETGSIGATGYTGPIGTTGYTGPIGTTGYTGPIGTTGYTGPIGETGSIGTTGYTGPIGTTGYTGPIGATGYTGYTGPSLWTQSDSIIYYNSGNVGIGNINPQTPLSVLGNAYISGNLQVGSSSIHLLGNENRFGIGKFPNSLYALDMLGNINLTGNIYQNGSLFSGNISNAADKYERILYNNSYYANDNYRDIQVALDASGAEQGIVVYVGSGSYGGTDLLITDRQNIGIIGPTPGGGTITELPIMVSLPGSRGIQISGAASTRVRITGLQVKGLTTITGTLGRHYFSKMNFEGGFTFAGSTSNFIIFEECAFASSLTIPNTFAGVIYFIRCDMGNINMSNSAFSALQVLIYDCTNLYSFSMGNTTLLSQNYLASGLSRLDVSNVYFTGNLYQNNVLQNISTIQSNMTVSATTSAPTLGTRSIEQINYRTIGDKRHICYRLGWAVGTAGSGDYLYTLPSGISFNTSSGYNPTYTGTIWSPSVNDMALYLIPISGGIVQNGNWSTHGYVIPYSSTTFRLAFTNNNTNSFGVHSSSWLPFTSEGLINIEFDMFV